MGRIIICSKWWHRWSKWLGITIRQANYNSRLWYYWCVWWRLQQLNKHTNYTIYNNTDFRRYKFILYRCKSRCKNRSRINKWFIWCYNFITKSRWSIIMDRIKLVTWCYKCSTNFKCFSCTSISTIFNC